VSAIASLCGTPIHEFIFYVLNDMTCESQCWSAEACCTFQCETDPQAELEGSSTEVRIGDCCLARHE
jgi:hypothetical protein